MILGTELIFGRKQVEKNRNQLLPSLNFIFLKTVLLWAEFVCRSNES